MITVAREGAELAQLMTEEFFVDCIRKKVVFASDHYWKEGMDGWQPVSAFVREQKLLKPKRTWRDNPATENQITCLESNGVPGAALMTKGEAHDRIGIIMHGPATEGQI